MNPSEWSLEECRVSADHNTPPHLCGPPNAQVRSAPPTTALQPWSATVLTAWWQLLLNNWCLAKGLFTSGNADFPVCLFVCFFNSRSSGVNIHMRSFFKLLLQAVQKRSSLHRICKMMWAKYPQIISSEICICCMRFPLYCNNILLLDMMPDYPCRPLSKLLCNHSVVLLLFFFPGL